MKRTSSYGSIVDTFKMTTEADIVAEIRRLLDEQMRLLEGPLSPLETTEYLLRQNKITELLKSLNSVDPEPN